MFNFKLKILNKKNLAPTNQALIIKEYVYNNSRSIIDKV